MKVVSRFVLLVFALFLAWLVVLADSGGASGFFTLAGSIPLGDKLGHMVLFGTLSFLVNVSLKSRQWVVWKWSFSTGTLWILGLVTFEEFSQLFFRSRSFDLLDLAADFVGILVAAKLAVALGTCSAGEVAENNRR